MRFQGWGYILPQTLGVLEWAVELCVGRTRGPIPCSPCPPSIGGLADVTASGLISRPAAASRFLSNLCMVGRLLSARGQAGKAIQLGSRAGLQPPVCLAVTPLGCGSPVPPASQRGHWRALVLLHPACPLPHLGAWGCWCTVPFLFVRQETQQWHNIQYEITAMGLLAPHRVWGSPPSPASPLAGLVLGARSSATAQCWMWTSVSATPVALVLPMHSMSLPPWLFWAASWAEMSPAPAAAGWGAGTPRWPLGAHSAAPYNYVGLAKNSPAAEPQPGCCRETSGK